MCRALVGRYHFCTGKNSCIWILMIRGWLRLEGYMAAWNWPIKVRDRGVLWSIKSSGCRWLRTNVDLGLGGAAISHRRGGRNHGRQSCSSRNCRHQCCCSPLDPWSRRRVVVAFVISTSGVSSGGGGARLERRRWWHASVSGQSQEDEGLRNVHTNVEDDEVSKSRGLPGSMKTHARVGNRGGASRFSVLKFRGETWADFDGDKSIRA